jgi:hypothetical protein
MYSCNYCTATKAVPSIYYELLLHKQPLSIHPSSMSITITTTTTNARTKHKTCTENSHARPLLDAR